MKTIEIRDVHLKVEDIERSVKFYSDVVGLHVLKVDSDQAELAIGKHHYLYLSKGVHNPFASTGLYHIALLLPTEEDLGRFLHHLSKMGFYEVGAGDHIFSQALYFDDPDGNGIEVYADRSKDKWVYDGDGLKGATLPVDINRLLAIGQGVWTGLPRDTTIGHLHLQVNDLAEVNRVFVQGMGFDIMTKVPSALFISKDGYHHHIGANTWAGTNLIIKDDTMAGLDYFTLAVSDIVQYEKLLQEHKIEYIDINNELEVIDSNGIKMRIVSM